MIKKKNNPNPKLNTQSRMFHQNCIIITFNFCRADDWWHFLLSQDFNPLQLWRLFFLKKKKRELWAVAHSSAGLLRSRRSCLAHLFTPGNHTPLKHRGWDVALWNLGKGEQEHTCKFISTWVSSAPPRNICLDTILAAVLVVLCTYHIYSSYYQWKSWTKKHLFQFYLCKVVHFSLTKQQRNVSYKKEMLNVKESKTNPQPSRTKAITDI